MTRAYQSPSDTPIRSFMDRVKIDDDQHPLFPPPHTI